MDALSRAEATFSRRRRGSAVDKLGPECRLDHGFRQAAISSPDLRDNLMLIELALMHGDAQSIFAELLQRSEGQPANGQSRSCAAT